MRDEIFPAAHQQIFNSLNVILNEVKDLLIYMLEYEILRFAQNDIIPFL